MSRKQLGVCSGCKEEVRPEVIEENTFRRDVCRCPECGATILVCRDPFCNNYALGGDFYDDELCFICFDTRMEVIGPPVINTLLKFFKR